MDDAEITFDMMLRAGVRELNCGVASVGPIALQQRGATCARDLRELGFDALSLCAADVCNEAVLAFGAEDVRTAFLVTAADAVCIVNHPARHMLGATPAQLFAVCAGCPGEAVEVLRMLPAGTALDGVSVATLLDAGLRAPTLAKHGYGLAKVVACLSPTEGQLRKLGFGL